jgi:hypothetical protein
MNKVRYGDVIVMESCDSDDHLFLGVVPRMKGRRHPLQLSTEVAEADKHPGCDSQWRVLPLAGSKKKWGDPIGFGDRVRLQMLDCRDQSRMLAVSHLDNRSIMAERRPPSAESCTWWLSYSAELAAGRDGRLVPTGDFAPFLEYGDANYVTFINRAGYLGAIDDPYRILRKRTAVFDDLPERGMSAWWRIHRSTSDLVSAVRRELHAAATRGTQAPVLSAAA